MDFGVDSLAFQPNFPFTPRHFQYLLRLVVDFLLFVEAQGKKNKKREKKCSNFNEKIPKKNCMFKESQSRQKKETPDKLSDTGNILLDRPVQIFFHFFSFFPEGGKTEVGVSSPGNSNSQLNDCARRSFQLICESKKNNIKKPGGGLESDLKFSLNNEIFAQKMGALEGALIRIQCETEE